jgi:lipoate-protein ligase A
LNFRLILDAPLRPALNMAIDEVLLEHQKKPDSAPCLRFYSWEKPAISCGYFQGVPEVARRFRAAEKKMQVVRRLTGGGLVFHGEDLTFSLTLTATHPRFSGDVKSSYLKVNQVLWRVLKGMYEGLDYADCKSVPSGRARGERVCFESPSCYDLLLAGKKVVGSSQRRLGSAVLHQSSVFLKGNRGAIIRSIALGFETEWGVVLEEKPLSDSERAAAEKIVLARYGRAEWAYVGA